MIMTIGICLPITNLMSFSLSVNGVVNTTIKQVKAPVLRKGFGKKVYLGAADTFRAAAVEQICIWEKRAGGACGEAADGVRSCFCCLRYPPEC